MKNKTNPISTHLALSSLAILLLPLLAGAQPQPATTTANAPAPPFVWDGQHDFDFEVGTWKTQLKRRLNPLASPAAWVEYEGTTVVRKVWDGRATLLELEADGPAGHFEGLGLRLYNPSSHQWSLHFSNSKVGTLTRPAVGEFDPEESRAEFHAQDEVNGRAVLVRFVISDITTDSCKFERSFSDDGGKTWELNWIAMETRIKEDSGQRR